MEQWPPRGPSEPEQVGPPGDRGTTGALGRPEEDRQAAENYGIRGHQSGKSTLTPVFAVFPVFLLLHELRERLRDRRLIRQDVEHRSEEHTSELQSLMRISYAVFCLTKKKHKTDNKRYNILQLENNIQSDD